MKKIKLTITGCLGRMGKELVKSSKNSKNFKLVSITENRIVSKKVSGLRPQLNSESAFKNANVIIDFTVPKCTLEILKIASKMKKRVVIGTTGFSKREEKLIKKCIQFRSAGWPHKRTSSSGLSQEPAPKSAVGHPAADPLNDK